MTIEILEKFMKEQGYVRLDDYDDSSCSVPTLQGDIYNFYNPTTLQAVSCSVGPVYDDMMFGEEMKYEAYEKFGNGEKKWTLEKK